MAFGYKPPTKYTLLIITNQKCKKPDCKFESNYILIGKENELIGFYCESHGQIAREAFELKFQFEKENKIITISKKKKFQKRKYKELTAKNCWECKKPFETSKDKKVFCSDTCRFKNWERNHPRMKL